MVDLGKYDLISFYVKTDIDYWHNLWYKVERSYMELIEI